MMRTIMTNSMMWSDDHPHTAQRVGPGRWEVSWIPGRTFTRDQATTATVVADMLAAAGTTSPIHLTSVQLAFLEHWSEELNLVVSEMLALFEATKH